MTWIERERERLLRVPFIKQRAGGLPRENLVMRRGNSILILCCNFDNLEREINKDNKNLKYSSQYFPDLKRIYSPLK